MRSTNWFIVFCLAAATGVLFGYIYALMYRPLLLPPILRLGSLIQPTTVLFLGTDVVYSDVGRRKRADKDAFNGRSDTIMVARLDPFRNTLSILSIPRDTQVNIGGYGLQKINAANALGAALAMRTVSELLRVPIDHYLVLNVHGLVELVDELGGVTIEVPKRMHYMDWTAKLKIDLDPGFHTLTGNQAMGFVRFRHDALGDIGRVQRQEIFVRAVLDKALKPDSWSHLPRLMDIAQHYIDTDMNFGQLMQMLTFVKAVPRQNQFLSMLPGTFSGNGDWLVQDSEIRRMVAHLMGSAFVNIGRSSVRVVLINASKVPDASYRLAKTLRELGYQLVVVKSEPMRALKKTRFIAQRGNPEDADILRSDLNNCGEIVNASLGDIQSGVTIVIGDELAQLLKGVNSNYSDILMFPLGN